MTPCIGFGILGKDRKTLLLSSSQNLYKLSYGAYGLWVLYVRQVLAWTSFEASLFLSWVGVLVGLNQGFLLRACVPNVLSVSVVVQLGFAVHAIQVCSPAANNSFALDERVSTFRLCSHHDLFLSLTAAPLPSQYICFGLLERPFQQWMMMAFTSPSSLADPSIRSALAERVSLPEQGKLQG